jgi:hypothetical protein
MPISHYLTRWLRLPGRFALILGLGALSTAGAQGDAPDQTSPRSFGDLSIRSEGGKIYLSEGGRDFQELQLPDTPEARHLKRLLAQNGIVTDPTDLQVNSVILAGGGGTGFSLWDIKRSVPDKPAPVPQDPPQVTAPPTLGLDPGTQQRSTPRDQTVVTGKKG